MTFACPTTPHPITILTATLAILTAHRVDTATAAPSPEHSWQDQSTSNQTKQKHFTKQHKYPDNEEVGFPFLFVFFFFCKYIMIISG